MEGNKLYGYFKWCIINDILKWGKNVHEIVSGKRLVGSSAKVDWIAYPNLRRYTYKYTHLFYFGTIFFQGLKFAYSNFSDTKAPNIKKYTSIFRNISEYCESKKNWSNPPRLFGNLLVSPTALNKSKKGTECRCLILVRIENAKIHRKNVIV